MLLGFGAVNTGNNLMYLLVSALLGFMAVSGWLGRNNLARLQFDVHLPEEIYDGVETLIMVRLYNRQRWLPACLLALQLQGGRVRCPLLVGGGNVQLAVAVTFRGRGVRKLGELRINSTFPINFFVRSLAFHLDRGILVFPRPLPIGLQAAAAAGITLGDLARDKGYEGDLTRINDYSGGEPLKLIHWKASARHDRLKVKELSSLVAPPLVIDPLKLPGRNLEERLSAACWLIKTLMRSGRSVGLQLGSGRIAANSGRPHQLRLLGALARYDRDTHSA